MVVVVRVVGSEESAVLRRAWGVTTVVAVLLVASGCGSDEPSSTLTPSSAVSPSATVLTPTPSPSSEPDEQGDNEAEQIVPEASVGESVELQFPPLSEQPAPGTDPNAPVNPDTVTEITCETVCDSTGCEQYQYSVLGCP
jgi:hypothetical protein